MFLLMMLITKEKSSFIMWCNNVYFQYIVKNWEFSGPMKTLSDQNWAFSLSGQGT